MTDTDPSHLLHQLADYPLGDTNSRLLVRKALSEAQAAGYEQGYRDGLTDASSSSFDERRRGKATPACGATTLVRLGVHADGTLTMNEDVADVRWLVCDLVERHEGQHAVEITHQGTTVVLRWGPS